TTGKVKATMTATLPFVARLRRLKANQIRPPRLACASRGVITTANGGALLTGSFGSQSDRP
ncbi:hypothetical protein NKH34_31440, partial [Mesorhizobium sp. M1148]|uniref:hypothetical protein n=1 Tax=unclassified Mesorhizobium TaxID=325217 RepID=UPI003339164A